MRQKQGVFSLFLLSPSSRRAWIEIYFARYLLCPVSVALLAEGVDRNLERSRRIADCAPVALLAEGVDRNSLLLSSGHPFPASPSSRRAWIEIHICALCAGFPAKSPSSRRAWIEMIRRGAAAGHHRVALLAEGVDRNKNARRAARVEVAVALLAEGVDRNIEGKPTSDGSRASPSSRRAWIEIRKKPRVRLEKDRRPPRGGRG